MLTVYLANYSHFSKNVSDKQAHGATVTWQDGPVQKGKVLKEPGVVEVADGKVALHQEHVLEQRAGGVSPIGYSFIQGAVSHVLQENHGLLHDGQDLLGPQVGLLKVT